VLVFALNSAKIVCRPRCFRKALEELTALQTLYNLGPIAELRGPLGGGKGREGKKVKGRKGIK